MQQKAKWFEYVHICGRGDRKPSFAGNHSGLCCSPWIINEAIMCCKPSTRSRRITPTETTSEVAFSHIWALISLLVFPLVSLSFKQRRPRFPVWQWGTPPTNNHTLPVTTLHRKAQATHRDTHFYAKDTSASFNLHSASFFSNIFWKCWKSSQVINNILV